MKFSEIEKNILRRAGTKIAGALISVLLKTVRIKIINGDSVKQLESEKRNYVFAFWHGSMLLGWYLNKNKNFASIVSRSKDGDVLASILERWNYKVIRGSSHTGGKEALETMIESAKQNFSIAITPDGPTGPIQKFKAGAVITAQRAAIPLVLAGIGIRKKWILKSWDKFEIPKPFTTAVVEFCDPIVIDLELDREETGSLILSCEKKLNQLYESALKKC